MTEKAIKAMMESLKQIQADNADFKASNEDIKQRLIKLETEKVQTAVKVENMDMGAGASGVAQTVVVQYASSSRRPLREC